MTGATQEGQVTIVTRPPPAAGVDKRRVGTYAWLGMRKFIMTNPLGAAGGGIVLVMVMTALLADVLAPYNPFEIN